MPVKSYATAAIALALLLGLLLLVGTRPSAPAASPSSTVAAVTTAPLTATSAPPIPPGYRVQIPRLVIDLPLAEGVIDRDTVRQETPEGWAFHLPGTALPGDAGNTYVYAHARPGMFLSLWNAREGDEVRIITPDGRVLRYRVSEVHPRVDPVDVAWAARTATERLTLQTSTGPNLGDPRFVVIALPA